MKNLFSSVLFRVSVPLCEVLVFFKKCTIIIDMKRSIFFAICVFSAVMFFACGTKKPVVADVEPVPVQNVPGAPKAEEPVESLIEVVHVSGGIFKMGFPQANRRNFTGVNNPWPDHYVAIRDFYIGKYEVTQGQYYQVMGENLSQNDKNPEDKSREGWKKLPVECVRWYDTLVFCNRLSVREKLKPVYSINGSVDPDDWGEVPATRRVPAWDAVKMDRDANGYRLPTEAEWEYAARGGAESRNFIYSGSNVAADVAWYEPSRDGRILGVIHGVGNKQPNELGLYDMSGNVKEWCWDWEGAYPSSAQNNPINNPLGPSTGTYRIIRGGSWSEAEAYCVVQSRDKNDPFFGALKGGMNLGFRVARNK